MISRIAPPAALDGLAELHALAFDRPWSASELEALALGPGAAVLVARDDDGRTLGFILIRRAADEAEILTLAVRPCARRAGVGRALVEAAATAAAAEGAARLFLEAAADNAAALALYAAAGFVAAGRRRGYYPRPGEAAVDAVVLRRDA